jgi:hypothetical protein
VGVRLVGAQFKPLWGGPHDDLVYESKCWVGFNLQFDKLTNCIGVDQ